MTSRDRASIDIGTTDTPSRAGGGLPVSSPHLLSNAKSDYAKGVRDGFLLGMELGLNHTNDQLARVIDAVKTNYKEAS